MSLLIVGSIALDEIRTPQATVQNELGGSAPPASLAASLYTVPHILGVVGQDFPEHYRTLLTERGIDTTGMIQQTGNTFRWGGQYHDNMHTRTTLYTELGVFADFSPEHYSEFSRHTMVFLGNIQPALQQAVLDQVPQAFTAMDTIQLWIDTAFDELINVIKQVDMLFLNEEEARQVAGKPGLLDAATTLLSWGISYLVIKFGEFGAMLMTKEGTQLITPAFIVEQVIDPTGAGDSFAGAMLGKLHAQNVAGKGAVIAPQLLKQALLQGILVGSFTVQDFCTRRLQSLTQEQVQEREQLFLKRLFCKT